jgi:hypothetical protein
MRAVGRFLIALTACFPAYRPTPNITTAATSISAASATATSTRRTLKAPRYGPDKNMVDLRLKLAAGCPKIAANKIMDLCGVYYPDRIGRA